MGLFSRLFARPALLSPRAATQPDGPGVLIDSSQKLDEFLRRGHETASGEYVTAASAMHNMAVFRSVDLIASAMGMLPTNLMRVGGDGALTEAVDLPLFDLLRHQPNPRDTAFEFKSTMQAWALLHGDAHAMIVWSRGLPLAIWPLHPDRLSVEEMPDLSRRYHYARPNGARLTLTEREIFRVRGLSLDASLGLARARVAREAIGVAMRAEKAAARLFKFGLLAGGALSHPGPGKFSSEAYDRLKASMAAREGADHAGKWLILEEGMKAEKFGDTAQHNQHVEQRTHQIEEIARAFGVPRPLLMMDDTSWGSGVEQLAMLFVRFGLAPWFKAWEEALARAFIAPADRRRLRFDFDEQELLRGTMKEQGEFFAKALGAGGSDGWLTANEVRRQTGYGPKPGGDELPKRAAPSPQTAPKPASSGDDDEPAQAA